MAVKNVLVTTTWSFHHGLIQSAVMPYLEIIKEIHPEIHFYLVTSETRTLPPIKSSLFTHLPFLQHDFGRKKMLHFPKQILQLCKLVFTKKINVIHSFSSSAAFIGDILSRLTRAKLIVDSYEPHAEAMVENGTWKENSSAYKLMFHSERSQTRRAVALISGTEGMYNYAKEKYGFSPKNFFVKPSCVDVDKFFPSKTLRKETRSMLGYNDKIVFVYAGKLGGIYLDAEVFSLLRVAADHFGERFRFLMLTGESKDSIFKKTAAVGLPERVITVVHAQYDDVNKYLNAADIALTPVKPVPSKRYCSPIKDGEYWAVGLPIIIPANISDDSDIIEDQNIGVILHALNEKVYKDAMTKIDALLQIEKDHLKSRIRNVAIKFRSYEKAKKVYESIYGASGIVNF